MDENDVEGEKMKGKAAEIQRDVTITETREGIWRKLGLTVSGALLGLLCAGSVVYEDIAPFSVGVAAAFSGSGSLLVYLACVIGYLFGHSSISAVRYIAAIAAVGGLKWVCEGIPFLEARRWAPLFSFVSVFGTGLTIASSAGISIYQVWLLLCEGLLCAGFTYFVQVGLRALWTPHDRASTLSEQAAVVVIFAVVLMSLARLSLGDISPGRIAAVFLILLCAHAGKENGGSIAGIVFGTTMALAAPEEMMYAVAFAFGGLLSGMFSRYGKITCAGTFLLADMVITVGSGEGILIMASVYETIMASFLFLALPRKAERVFHGFFNRAEEKPAVEGLRRSVVMRLNVASKAMEEVAGTVDQVSKKLAGFSAPDLGSVYYGVSDNVCQTCAMKLACWEKSLNDTMDSFNHLTPILREQGKVTKKDFEGILKSRCARLDEIAFEINRRYGDHCLREGAFRRLNEIRSVVTDQFSGMAELLNEFSYDFKNAEQVDTDAAARVRNVCEEYNMDVHETVCTVGKGNRMQVEIVAVDMAAKIRQKEWLSRISDACGRSFAPPVVTRMGALAKIALFEQPRYRVQVGAAQLCAGGERLCGDAYEVFKDSGGRFCAVLSDGMGSGGRAAVDGAMAAGLTARLFKAGFGEDSVLRMVNSALMVKSGDESLATLDVLSIDLFSGKLKSLKAGAATSLLLSHGRISRLEHSSLPAGILRDIRFETQGDTLTAGDVVLLVSDGVYAGGIGWVEQALKRFEPAKTSLQSLAEEIAVAARKLQKAGHSDDVTVVALRLEKTEI